MGFWDTLFGKRDGRLKKIASANAGKREARSFRPCLEQLEDRTVMSTLQLLANPSFSSGASSWNRSGDFYADTSLSNYRTGPGYSAGGVDTAGAGGGVCLTANVTTFELR